MYFTIILFGAAVLFLLAGAMPCLGGDGELIFKSPFFIAILTMISVLSLYCCWKRIRHPVFLLTHIGAVVILAGVLLTFLFGKNTEFKVPVDPAVSFNNIPAPDGSQWDLGFNFSVVDFRVGYYDSDNSGALTRKNAVPKNYEAKIRIIPKNGNDFACLLKVNHPVSYEGWRIYLVSFGGNGKPFVQLSAKKDIGRGTVISGIWMLMAGTFIICLKRKERF